MAKEFSRTQRIGDQMQRELAQLIQREVKDPRLGLITITAVEVSRDLSHAKIFIFPGLFRAKISILQFFCPAVIPLD